ncbi:hypothetical protein [Tepidiforma sp.]|uniref:VOC family protein n=1 Tax=Tepidiforma sp. TaxID=2682230 RepID=UPI002ADD7F40|nr:hypothetical protein [Tepidiforma sp.]
MARNSPLSLTLWATDVGALADFLSAVTGAEVVARHPGYAELNHQGCDIEIHADETFRGHPWYEALAREGVARGIGAELTFRVDDVLQRFRAAQRLGAQVIAAPYEFEGRLECQLMGPDGYVLGLWQPWNSATSA